MKKKSSPRNNKLVIALFDLIALVVFAIPLVIERAGRKRMAGQEIKNILVMELWGLGDLVLASGVRHSLRELFPQAEIDLLAKPIAGELFQGASAFNKVIGFNFPWTQFQGKYQLRRWDWRGLWRVLGQLRRKKYDLVVDARGDIRNNILAFLIVARWRLGYRWTGGGFFLTACGAQSTKDGHRGQAWAELLRMLGGQEEFCQPQIAVSSEEKAWASEYLKQQGIGPDDFVIGIHPGAGQKIRCWPLEHFAKVAAYARTQFRAKVVVLADPDGYGQEIPLDGQKAVVRRPLRELLSVLAQLDVLICNDSGVMHLATAVRTPVLAIFGAGGFRKFGPVGRACRVVYKEMSCRPCYDNCIHGTARCLEAISVETVVKVLNDMVSTKVIKV